MYNNHSTIHLSFEDVQNIMKEPSCLLINVMPDNQQMCLIPNTQSPENEVKRINQLVQTRNMQEYSILLYGKNSDDGAALEKKRRELRFLGFQDVYIYLGGMFEWLLLQDIWGRELFPTTSQVLDILQYRTLPKLKR